MRLAVPEVIDVTLPPGTDAGLSNVTVCSIPELFTQTTVDPRATVTVVGKKVVAVIQN